MTLNYADITSHNLLSATVSSFIVSMLTSDSDLGGGHRRHASHVDVTQYGSGGGVVSGIGGYSELGVHRRTHSSAGLPGVSVGINLSVHTSSSSSSSSSANLPLPLTNGGDSFSYEKSTVTATLSDSGQHGKIASLVHQDGGDDAAAAEFDISRWKDGGGTKNSGGTTTAGEDPDVTPVGSLVEREGYHLGQRGSVSLSTAPVLNNTLMNTSLDGDEIDSTLTMTEELRGRLVAELEAQRQYLHKHDVAIARRANLQLDLQFALVETDEATKQMQQRVAPQAVAEAVTGSTTTTSWLLRLFESKLFDMSLAITYLFNSKEPGVQTYIGMV